MALFVGGTFQDGGRLGTGADVPEMNACAHDAAVSAFAGRACHANRRRHDFHAFADDTASVSIGTLMFENGTDRIAVVHCRARK